MRSRSIIADAPVFGRSVPESVQSTADDFFKIVGTDAPMRLADHIGTKTAEQVGETKARKRRAAPRWPVP
jgi:hypothetical protein